MITSEQLDGFKLISDENNIATEGQALRSIEDAIVQGSQGWGVRAEVAVLLQMVSQLRMQMARAEAFTAKAAQAHEALNALKGKQLELGRVRAELDRQKALAESCTEIIRKNRIQIDALRQELAKPVDIAD